MLFSGLDAAGNVGLWKTDGTAAGTQELTGIAGADPGTDPGDPGLDPRFLINFNGKVLFNGQDANHQLGLWSTDGTVAGTHEIFPPGIVATSLDPSNFEIFNGEVLFNGFDSSGHRQLWETDGTTAGTQEVTGSATGLSPVDLTAIGTPDLSAGGSQGYLSGAAPIALDPTLIIYNPQTPTGASVSISAGFHAGDTLSVGSPQAGITSSYDAGTGVLTLSGAASLAAYQAALDSVTFATSSAVTPTTRTIAWSINDGTLTSPPRAAAWRSSSITLT